eukprot:6092373-Alexandrium_andersonii.AAC.1
MRRSDVPGGSEDFSEWWDAEGNTSSGGNASSAVPELSTLACTSREAFRVDFGRLALVGPSGAQAGR